MKVVVAKKTLLFSMLTLLLMTSGCLTEEKDNSTLDTEPFNEEVGEQDSDGDGVPDSEDKCEGHDDNEDADGDGTPDGCDDDT